MEIFQSWLAEASEESASVTFACAHEHSHEHALEHSHEERTNQDTHDHSHGHSHGHSHHAHEEREVVEAHACDQEPEDSLGRRIGELLVKEAQRKVRMKCMSMCSCCTLY